MKRSIFVLLLAGLVVVTASFSGPAPAEDTELTKHMKAMNTALRGLRTQMRSEERRPAANASILEAQMHALSAKALDPELLAEQPEEEQAAFRVEYRKRMHEMLNRMFELEIALLEGRVDDAKSAYKALQKGKAPAHKKFMKDED